MTLSELPKQIWAGMPVVWGRWIAELRRIVNAHIAAADPHPQYLTAAEANAAYEPATSFLPRGLYNMVASPTLSGVQTDAAMYSDTDAKGTRTIPANFFSAKGVALRFYTCGHYSTDASPGNATVAIKFGSTTYVTTGSFSLDGNVTNGLWRLSGLLTCVTTGATGTIKGNTAWEHEEETVAGTVHEEEMIVTSPVTVNLTAPQEFKVLWSATDAGTSITTTCFALWAEFE